jgi:subtilisin-like proprotein convertase family protein
MVGLVFVCFGIPADVGAATLPPMTRSFTNAAAIAILDDGPAGTYPSTINVSGMTGTVTRVSVQLRGVTHPFPDDIDILLVPPGGPALFVMSDAGGSFPLSGTTFSIEDGAPIVPNSAQIASAVYAPANHGLTADMFPSPAPAAPYAVGFTNANGINPNGAWRLFVYDDALESTGTIAAGWALTISAAELLPELTLSRQGQTLQISWASGLSGYVLEGRGHLESPPSWSAVTNAVIVTNGQNRVTVPLNDASRYFRLKK